MQVHNCVKFVLLDLDTKRGSWIGMDKLYNATNFQLENRYRQITR